MIRHNTFRIVAWLGLSASFACGGSSPGGTGNATSSDSDTPATTAPTSDGSATESGVDSAGATDTATATTTATATSGGPTCEGFDCGPDGSCVAQDDGPVCVCDDGFVDIEDTCVSTDLWKLEEGHWVPAKMPMTVVHPRPDDETQTWARARVAHPDFRYEIPVGVQGGAWPFLYELVQAPDGAEIGQVYGQDNYGVVTWDPTDSNTQTFEVRITDQDLETITMTWTVAVDPAPFVFVDGDNGDDAGTGEIDDPLRTFSGWYLDDVDDNTYAERILVFRESTDPYLMSGDPVQSNNNCRISSATKPIVWIAYPDESPVLDASQSKVFVQAPRADLYISGLRFEHGRQDVANAQFFWVTAAGDRITFWRNEYVDLGPGEIGNDNTGPVFISGTGPEKFYILTKDNLYEDIANEGFNGHFFEVYRSTYVLYEEEVARNSNSGAGWFPKGAIANITVRNNTAVDGVSGRMVSGSFGGEAGQLPHDHEFCWNNVSVESGAGFLFSGSNSYAGEHYGGSVYRNTIAGADPWLRFLGAEPYETDGNVIVTGDPSRFGDGIVVHLYEDDLLSAPGDGIIADDGLLVGQARTDYLGLRGHEVD